MEDITMEFEIKVYSKEDLQRLEPVITEAKEIWRDRCEKFIKKRGDIGTPMSEASLYVKYLPSEYQKNPIRKTIIKVSEVCNAKCSAVWEVSMYDVMDFLSDHGIKAFYESGWMD